MQTLNYRTATESDLAFIDQLALEDEIGTARDPVREDHAEQTLTGFRAMVSDPNHTFYVVERFGEPVACFQLSFIPGISRNGAWRGQIESVRVRAALRGEGIGAEMMRWAIKRCEERGCGIVQLTSDSNRAAAHKFYDRLGFSATHTGFKLKLR